MHSNTRNWGHWECDRILKCEMSITQIIVCLTKTLCRTTVMRHFHKLVYIGLEKSNNLKSRWAVHYRENCHRCLIIQRDGYSVRNVKCPVCFSFTCCEFEFQYRMWNPNIRMLSPVLFSHVKPTGFCTLLKYIGFFHMSFYYMWNWNLFLYSVQQKVTQIVSIFQLTTIKSCTVGLVWNFGTSAHVITSTSMLLQSSRLIRLNYKSDNKIICHLHGRSDQKSDTFIVPLILIRASSVTLFKLHVLRVNTAGVAREHCMCCARTLHVLRTNIICCMCCTWPSQVLHRSTACVACEHCCRCCTWPSQVLRPNIAGAAQEHACVCAFACGGVSCCLPVWLKLEELNLIRISHDEIQLTPLHPTTVHLLRRSNSTN